MVVKRKHDRQRDRKMYIQAVALVMVLKRQLKFLNAADRFTMPDVSKRAQKAFIKADFLECT